MEISVDNKGIPLENKEYRKYEVDFETCTIEENDMVTPETLVGYRHQDGKPVRAGLYGYIASIFFNPMHNSLMVLALAIPYHKDKIEMPGQYRNCTT